MRDGSRVKSIVKRLSLPSNNSDTVYSVDSMPDRQLSGEKVKAKGLRRCAFSSVDIREHERVAGDNPCVTSGVPLSIGWGFYQHDPIDLDDYEYNRGPARDKIEMMVPATVRRQMLRDEFGVGIDEMNKAMREVNLTKRQRRHTVATEHLEGWAEVSQSVKRKFKRFMKGTSTAKEQEKMWEEAHTIAVKKYLKEHGEDSLGKNTSVARAGSFGAGQKVGPESQEQPPMLEISIHENEAEEVQTPMTPTFTIENHWGGATLSVKKSP